MSAKRRANKAKKKQSLQNLKKAEVRRMPHARRKGGQYIYPAGAYRAAMIDPPEVILKSAEPLITEDLPVLEPAAEALIPASEAVPSEEGRLRWQYWAAAVLTVFMMAMALTPAKSGSRAAGLTKLLPEREHLSAIELEEAETPGPLQAVVDVETVRQPLEEYLSDLPGDWAVYLKNLSNDQELVINDHQMPSASLIKLFVAGTYFEQLESGALSSTARSEYDLEMMISWSDNTAWQNLETFIGKGSYTNGLGMVTDFAMAHGYQDTGRLIGGSSIYSGENLTSVSDVGRVLGEIVQGTYVSENASASILELMKQQHITTKIPAGLPEGIESANKTGELSGVENDAAIVYGLNTDYILVVMSDGNYIGTTPVAQISEIVYETLNPGAGSSEDLT